MRLALSRKDALQLVVLTVLWGLNWPVMKLGVRDFAPLSFRTLCMAGGAVLRYLEPIERDGARRALLLSTLSRRALGGHLEEISRDRFEDRPDGVLLIDGELRATLAVTGTITADTGAMAIGNDDIAGGALNNPLAGDIAEVSVWSVARSASDIKADLYRSFKGDEAAWSAAGA